MREKGLVGEGSICKTAILQKFVVVHKKTSVAIAVNAADSIDAARRVGWAVEDCIVVGPFKRLNFM